MTAHQVYEQSVKALSVPEKLALARLIIDEVVPQSQPEAPALARQPRQFGAGRHLLSGAGIDVNELMAVSIDDMFADYMPEDHSCSTSLTHQPSFGSLKGRRDCLFIER